MTAVFRGLFIDAMLSDFFSVLGSAIDCFWSQSLPIVFSLKTHPISAIYFSPPASKLPIKYDDAQKLIETNQRAALTVIFKKIVFNNALCFVQKLLYFFHFSANFHHFFFIFSPAPTPSPYPSCQTTRTGRSRSPCPPRLFPLFFSFFFSQFFFFSGSKTPYFFLFSANFHHFFFIFSPAPSL
jgi:hypothetical protein